MCSGIDGLGTETESKDTSEWGNSALLESKMYCEEWGIGEGYLLLHGDGHEWLALDYRAKTAEPSVVALKQDGDDVEDGEEFEVCFCLPFTCYNLDRVANLLLHLKLICGH